MPIVDDRNTVVDIEITLGLVAVKYYTIWEMNKNKSVVET